MRLVYTQHARLRMAEERLSEADVEAIIAHPYATRHSRTTGDTMYFGRVGGRNVVVITARGSVPQRVITVWTT
jgi:hypothetical protein